MPSTNRHACAVMFALLSNAFTGVAGEIPRLLHLPTSVRSISARVHNVKVAAGKGLYVSNAIDTQYTLVDNGGYELNPSTRSRIVDVSISSDARYAFVATINGTGLHRYDLMLETWSNITPPSAGQAISSIYVDTVTQTLWAGTGGNVQLNNMFDARGLFYSTDWGVTWTATSNPFGASSSSWGGVMEITRAGDRGMIVTFKAYANGSNNAMYLLNPDGSWTYISSVNPPHCVFVDDRVHYIGAGRPIQIGFNNDGTPMIGKPVNGIFGVAKFIDVWNMDTTVCISDVNGSSGFLVNLIVDTVVVDTFQMFEDIRSGLVNNFSHDHSEGIHKIEYSGSGSHALWSSNSAPASVEYQPPQPIVINSIFARHWTLLNIDSQGWVICSDEETKPVHGLPADATNQFRTDIADSVLVVTPRFVFSVKSSFADTVFSQQQFSNILSTVQSASQSGDSTILLASTSSMYSYNVYRKELSTHSLEGWPRSSETNALLPITRLWEYDGTHYAWAQSDFRYPSSLELAGLYRFHGAAWVRVCEPYTENRSHLIDACFNNGRLLTSTVEPFAGQGFSLPTISLIDVESGVLNEISKDEEVVPMVECVRELHNGTVIWSTDYATNWMLSEGDPTYSTLDFGRIVDVGVVDQTSWIVTADSGVYVVRDISQVTSIEENVVRLPEEKRSIILYPNPAKDHVTISGTPPSDGVIELYSSIGEKPIASHLMHDVKVGASTRLDLSSIPNGLYFVVIRGGLYQHMEPLIVCR